MLVPIPEVLLLALCEPLVGDEGEAADEGPAGGQHLRVHHQLGLPPDRKRRIASGYYH